MTARQAQINEFFLYFEDFKI